MAAIASGAVAVAFVVAVPAITGGAVKLRRDHKTPAMGKKHSDEIWTNFFPLPRLFNSFYPEQQFQLLAGVISSCHGNRGRLAPQQLIEHT